MAKLTDQLRQAIDASGMSRYRICKSIDLDQATMSKFMKGRQGLALDTLDRLGELMGLKLVATKKPVKGKGR
jgi:plasmid maintenance system antidote protein VapI